jgi:hypothetical protein
MPFKYEQERRQARPYHMPTSNFHTKKQKRIFQRLSTGLQIARNQGQVMRFMTLTTSKERVVIKRGKRKGEVRTPKDSFDILRNRISKATMQKYGFIGFNLRKYYCLRTREGNGVLHIVYWGNIGYIPIQWLKRNWYEIHGGYECDIQEIQNRRKQVNGIVMYLLDNYLMRQDIARMSYGWGWAWLGFCKSWEKTKYYYGKLRSTKGALESREIDKSKIDVSSHRRFQCKPPRWVYDWETPPAWKSVNAWKCTLHNPPKTSRQLKFFSPSMAGILSSGWLVNGEQFFTGIYTVRFFAWI